MNSNIHLAIVGATGAVGREVLHCLEKRDFPLSLLKGLTSRESSSKELLFQKKPFPLEPLSEQALENVDLVIFCTESEISKKWVPIALKKGALVIDMSSHFRQDKEALLLIPEINAHQISQDRRLFCSPNCCATLLLMVLAPLYKEVRTKRIVMTTYQSASGGGYAMMQALQKQTRAQLAGETFDSVALPHPYAFNLFTHNSPFTEQGYAEEEIKIKEECCRILDNPSLAIHSTCVRVPVMRAHSLAVNISFEEEISVKRAYAILQKAPGVKIVEDRKANRFAMPSDASFQDAILCGRIRKDPSYPHTLDLWIVGDQLLKGAALNAVQIAEILATNREMLQN